MKDGLTTFGQVMRAIGWGTNDAAVYFAVEPRLILTWFYVLNPSEARHVGRLFGLLKRFKPELFEGIEVEPKQ